MEIKIMKIITALLILTVSLFAETRPVKVVGDQVIPLPERLASKATHSIELTAEQYKTYTSSRYFKVVDGQPVVKTLEEVEAEKTAQLKEQATKEAVSLAKQLKATPEVTEGSDTYVFTELSQTLFLAQYMNSETDIRVRRKSKKAEKMTKSKAMLIFAKLSLFHNAVEDALELDLEAIDAGDYTCGNLKGLTN